MAAQTQTQTQVALPGDLLLVRGDDVDGGAAGAGAAETEPRARVGGGVAVMQSSSTSVAIMATRRGRAHLPDAPAEPARRKKKERTASAACWVEPVRQSRYTAQPKDHVVGAIVQQHADQFSVDIGGPHPAVLPALAFEGATRRNRPNLRAGSLVFARVVAADRDTEPELSCVDEDGRSGDAGFGELKGEGHGYVLQVPTSSARALLSLDAGAADGGGDLGRRLRALGEETPFEMVVGANGRVWLCSAKAADVLRISSRVLDAIHGGSK